MTGSGRADRDAASQGFSTGEISALAGIFPPGRPARSLLREATYPLTELPAGAETAVLFWEQVSESLADGIMPDGRHKILTAAARRYPGQQAFRAPPGRVLILGASPDGSRRIRPDRDARAAAEAAGLVISYRPAAVATDLRAVLDFGPDVLHLACHGAGDSLVFEDAHGEEHRVPAADVAGMLRLCRDIRRARLHGLVLASCEGEAIAAHFTDVADWVVAHRGALDDGCATVFARHLYDLLPAAGSVADAARLAAQQALLTDPGCAAMPSALVVLPGRE